MKKIFDYISRLLLRFWPALAAFLIYCFLWHSFLGMILEVIFFTAVQFVYKVYKEEYKPKEKSIKIKQECELMYKQIKDAQERLEELRKKCTHENTFIGYYSFRLGQMSKAVICDDCSKPLEFLDDDKGGCITFKVTTSGSYRHKQ